jgi:hypothetical protein
VPRYRFHLYEPDRPERDDHGSDCANIRHARLHAVRMARDVMAGNVMEGWLHLGSMIEIENEAGEVEDRLLFADALAVTR